MGRLKKLRWSWSGKAVTLDPVEEIKRLLALPIADHLEAAGDAFSAIINERLWEARVDRSGGPFQSFSEFAVAPPPHGLGVRTEPMLLVARNALLARHFYAEWVELLKRHIREPGHPKKVTSEEDFPRRYQVSKSYGSIDRQLITLERNHSGLFTEVCQHLIMPRQAAIKAGLLPDPHAPSRNGACDFEAAKKFKPKAKVKLLRKLFHELGVDAQCTLIANVLEPVLGPDLARRWREAHSNNKQTDGGLPDS